MYGNLSHRIVALQLAIRFPWSSVNILLENKLRCLYSELILNSWLRSHYYETQWFIAFFTKFQARLLQMPFPIVHIYRIHFNPQLRLNLQSSLLSLVSRLQLCMHFSHLQCILHALLIPLHLVPLIILNSKGHKILITQFSLVSCCFLSQVKIF